jgi:hypothetical protein
LRSPKIIRRAGRLLIGGQPVLIPIVFEDVLFRSCRLTYHQNCVGHLNAGDNHVARCCCICHTERPPQGDSLDERRAA